MQVNLDTGNTITKDRNNGIKRFKIMIFQLLLFLMIFVPRTAQTPKIALIFILFGLEILSTLKGGKIRINKTSAVFMGLFLLYACLAGFIGVFRNNPGALDFLRVNIIYYVMFTFIISSISTIDEFEKITRTILFGSNAVAIYSILLLLVSIGIWPSSYFYAFDITSNVGIHSGYTHLTNTNLSMMIFMLPYVMTLYFNKYSFKSIKRSYLLITFILATIAILISGRRILWLSFIIPLLFYLIRNGRHYLIKNIKKLFVFGILAFVFLSGLSFISYFSLEDMIMRFTSAFTGSEGDIRTSQITALWNGFLRYPIFGSGAGIGVTEVVRSYTSPWAYEMSYNLILYNSGLVGTILFSGSHLYILYSLYKEKLKGKIIAEALFVSYVSVLVSNATNPYFSSSFDFLWFIFIPLVYFNINNNINV